MDALDPTDQGNVAPANGLSDLLFDRSSKWVEDPVTSFPALPRDQDLLPFAVSTLSPLTFKIDPHSLSIGKDYVIRYTVVITSPAGARNVRYEGLRCQTYEWRLYSGTNDTGTEWDHASTEWTPIEHSELNAYHAALYNDYFCQDKMPVVKMNRIVDSLRYHRPLNSNELGH